MRGSKVGIRTTVRGVYNKCADFWIAYPQNRSLPIYYYRFKKRSQSLSHVKCESSELASAENICNATSKRSALRGESALALYLENNPHIVTIKTGLVTVR